MMQSNIKRLLFILLSLTLFWEKAPAQCCGAGSPVAVSAADKKIRKNHLMLALDYRHSASKDYFQESKRFEGEFWGMLSDASYDFVSLSVGYGITNWLTVQTQLGYYINKSENFKNPQLPDASVYGLSDWAVSANFLAYENQQIGLQLVPFLSVKFPVGKFDCEQNGVKLPISMQPSSGSYKYTVGTFFYSNLSPKYYLTANLFYEYAQRIVSKNFNYKYGNLIFANVSTHYRIMPFFTLGVTVSYEYMGNARDGYGVLSQTDYHLLKAAPLLIFRPLKDFHILCSAELPLWRHVGGLQMSNQWAMQVKLVYDINLYKWTTI